MNWEKCTSPEIEAAVKKCGGVCLLAAGVMEKHGDHLPVGQDALYMHDICTRAAEKESAMVFPLYYFGQILEAKHVPGTIALRSDLLIPLLENVCDEIGRNGFRKIIIVNGHGGNIGLHSFFSHVFLDKKKDYFVYFSDPWFKDTGADAVKESKVDGHGGEMETSGMLYLHPELVKMERYAKYGMPLKRAQKFMDAGLSACNWWYSNYPGHFAGDQVLGTRKKGEFIVNAHVRHIVRQIKLIKRDEEPIRLYREFHRKAVKPANKR